MKLTSLLLALPIVLLSQVASAEILSVKLNSASFRENPHEAAKVKYTADKFYPVEVVEKKAGWVKVKDFEGDLAWVSEKALTKLETVVIAVDKANIREAANTTSDVLFKVERGEVFKIEEKKGQWLKVVDAHGDGGWLRRDMTWGEDPKIVAELDKVVDKVVDKVEKGEKPTTDAKPSETKAKEASSTETKKEAPKPEGVEDKIQKAADKVAGKLTEPENLETLCRAYIASEDVGKHASEAVAGAAKVATEVAAHGGKAEPKKSEPAKPAAKPQKKAEPKKSEKAKPAPKPAKPEKK